MCTSTCISIGWVPRFLVNLEQMHIFYQVKLKKKNMYIYINCLYGKIAFQLRVVLCFKISDFYLTPPEIIFGSPVVNSDLKLSPDQIGENHCCILQQVDCFILDLLMRSLVLIKFKIF